MDYDNSRPLDSAHDLSKGDKDYLKRKGISSQQFDKMDPTAQNEWKNECKTGYYEKNDYELGTVKRQKTYYMKNLNN